MHSVGDEGEVPYTPAGAPAARHLTAVAKPKAFLDRRAQPFVPVYLEFVASPQAERPGYGLSGNAAVFYSILLHIAGTPSDGRRQSRAEMEKKETFVRRVPSAGKLRKLYGWTYDQIDSWSKACAEPLLCPHCSRAHPLLRIDRRKGHKNTYTILRCQDLAEEDCIPPALVQKAKRIPTGAADPNTRPLRDDRRLGLPGFDALLAARTDAVGESKGREPTPEIGRAGTFADDAGLQTVGQSPTVLRRLEAEAHPKTLGQSPTVYASQLGQPDSGETAARGRIQVVAGFAMIERLTLPADAIEVIARSVEDPAELYSALIGVAAAASIDGAAITASFARTILGRRHTNQPSSSAERNSISVDSPREADTSDWAIQRILELARRREPGTGLDRARAYHKEFFAHCLAQTNGDEARAVSELMRVLTDPRCCGAMGHDPPAAPIAMIRSAFRDGWIWTDAGRDDGSNQLARAFERDLSPHLQREVERIFRTAAGGGTLDYNRLREYKISSKAMIAYLHRRFDMHSHNGTERIVATAKPAE